MTMRTITTQATVGPDGQVTLTLPPDVAPGEYPIVLVLGEQAAQQEHGQRPPLDFPVDDWGAWPEDFSLRREELYDDRGR